MSIRSLICVSGTSVAIGLATASAQQDTTTTQPDRYPTAATTTSSAEDLKSLLEKRQGVWQVSVTLNKDFWSRMGHGGATDNRYITPNDWSPDTKDPTGDPSAPDQGDKPQTDRPGDYPWKVDQEKKDPSTTQPSTTQPGQTDTMHTGQKQLSGYAEADLVLGDKILQERIIVPSSGEVRLDPAGGAGNVPPDSGAQADAAHQGGYRAISLMQFNEAAHTYDMVFMSNMTDGIRYDSGYFDAQRNRIVFRGGSSSTSTPQHTPSWDGGQGGHTTDPLDPSRRQPSDPQRTDPSDPSERLDPSRIQPSDPSERDWRPTHSSGMSGLENVVVVLEFVDDNTHKVTMYDTSSGSGAGQDWRNLDDADDPNDVEDVDEPGDIDGVDDPDDADDANDADDAFDDDDADDRDAVTPRPADPSRIASAQPGTTTGEFGRVIYEATYTRAPSSMEARIRSMIDESIAIASR